ncbi:hypothetical protein Ahy_Scaffold1g106758 isoform B [Arachis hypogaea]|uniref:ZF-HD dimerization-type domain-containing protein n=1 Tax=Arachis hypogaea TaxID=3818 RepID=A0A444WRZ5_ARAHY|nr:hypothetical protein Ahy_Scaffold1g106758 isoform B [Arachis hypogaea]
MGSHVVDGCGEFMPSGEEGTPESLRCAACECHRNFHRREQRFSHAIAAAAPPSVQPVMMAFGGGGGASASKKRFRTKFTQQQKDRMMEFAEKLGWKIQKHDEQEVQQFCSQVGVKRQVFKVWMHNNKQAIKKQQQQHT